MHSAPRILAVLVLAVASLATSIAHAQESEPNTPPGYDEGESSQPPPPPQGYGQPAWGQPGYGAQPLVPGAPVAPPATRARRVPVEREETIRGLWLPGLIVLPVAWVTTWTFASSIFVDDAVTFSWIPLVGPWLMLTQDLNGNEAGVVVSGVVQAVAALAIVLGLSIKRTYTDYEYVIEPAPGARLRLDAITLPGGGMIGAQLTL